MRYCLLPPENAAEAGVADQGRAISEVYRLGGQVLRTRATQLTVEVFGDAADALRSALPGWTVEAVQRSNATTALEGSLAHRQKGDSKD